VNNDKSVTGAAVVRIIGGVAASNCDVWILRSIETLSHAPSLPLGDFWRKVAEAPIEVQTNELCFALKQAFQVVTLDAELKGCPEKRLVVDDGEIIVCPS
jgi:hypothetical protein